MIDLDAQQLALVRRLVREHFPGAAARVFGSRITGGAKPYSDLDLAIVSVTGEPLPPARLQLLREALQAAPLTVRVDVLDWHATAAKFRAIIAARFEVL
ncbi:MAG: nucleotidyltransferase domain-containing protein [Verrucomicrobiales bacterium]|jgi:predicted nucleotidyltransferase|nr:nucleotidyltransferase domain-containing protein [Verrucomicrobiales bacterium]